MSKEENLENTEEIMDTPEGIRVYELGFHLVPTLSEDDVMVQFSHLKSLIEKRSGKFISEEAPKMMDLAYEIDKTVKAQKKRYTTSYFGWVKFDISPDEIAGLEKELKLFEPMLRYLLITTARESTLASLPTAAPAGKEGGKKSSKDGSEEAPAAIDEAKVDESIDQLVQA